MPITDPSPWVEFGLAGLFGVFAITLTLIYLRFLQKLMSETQKDREADRVQRAAIMATASNHLNELNVNIRELNVAMREFNGGKDAVQK